MELTNITISTSRKLNHQYYGGGQYESSDHFISLSAEVDESDNLIEVHKELKETTREMIEKDISNEIEGLSGGLTWAVFEKYLWNLTARRPVDPETYQQASRLQKMIFQAVKRGLQTAKRDEQK